MTKDELVAKTEEIKQFMREEFEKEPEKNHLKESEFLKFVSTIEWVEKKIKELKEF